MLKTVGCRTRTRPRAQSAPNSAKSPQRARNRGGTYQASLEPLARTHASGELLCLL